MSSYNENLHSSVVSSLNTQELELQSVEAKLEASMFSLYYAQGARITTAEELEITTAKYAFEKNVHEQAIIDSDLSTNVLESANNAKSYTSRSVTNTAVAAANVQIAANAILKLASTTGSIFSIINAADFDTDIYTQSNKANVLMNDTAYAAEQASQHSMEASASVAEVTTTTLAAKATVTDTSIKDLLSVVTKQFDDTTTLLSTQSAELATANTKEKQAEGVLEDYSVAYESTDIAFELSNSELNLDLTVTTPITIGNHDSYVVSFSPYLSAFSEQKSSTDTDPKDTNQPVQDYYIMLVENSKSATFSMNDAEGIITGAYANRYAQIVEADKIKNSAGVITGLKKKIYIAGTNSATHPVLQDSEGKALVLGKEYVVVVFATFKTAYKKIINTFDDYLSAPSKMFMLENQLNAVFSNAIQPPTDAQVINFGVFENPAYLVDSEGEEALDYIQYRCVFLPNNPNLVRGLLTDEELKYIDAQVSDKMKLDNMYTEKIATIQSQLDALKSDSKEAKTDTKSAKGAGAKKVSKTSATTISTTERTNLLSLQLKILTKQKSDALKDQEHLQPGFFFNLTTAEQIPAGSYTPAVPGTDTLLAYLLRSITNIGDLLDKLGEEKVTELNAKVESTIPKKTSAADKEQFINDIITLIEGAIESVIDGKEKTLEKLLVDFAQFIIELMLLAEGYKFYSKQVTLAAETTDNFGNRLIGNNAYIPTVISISKNADETVNTQFTNALSDFQHTDAFTYKDPFADATKIIAYPKQTTV
ncbi:hypothetical protein IMCC3317_26080 [Kordia antarctica]|uniref:Uncharacterized protein n=1 Tax=Kordia antarctica TaxID=1218801 RepID=A0A7L4ZL32_9FLAO|nr:hypothetical protein [Kordia antarctica]QHI37230.1 hypothetical protein IMCC3317_26080 [Kordia antarctica]